VSAFEPGVYDMPENVYHADPVPGGSLSASGAKKLLACPARFDYDRRHPPAPTSSMELGTAVHKLVLGRGAEIVVINAENWRKKADQDKAKEARAAGKVPLLTAERERAQAIADAVFDHPVAGSLFMGGQPERSLFWRDEEFGIWRRARLDWLPGVSPGRMIIPDLKTCKSGGASKAEITKAIVNYRYDMQAATYTDAVTALGLDDDPAFLFVFVETEPPHLVNIADLDDEDMYIGRELMRRACERYRDCLETGVWPGYEAETGDGITHISLPPWAARALEVSA
jgi:hypothetical protein